MKLKLREISAVSYYSTIDVLLNQTSLAICYCQHHNS